MEDNKIGGRLCGEIHGIGNRKTLMDTINNKCQLLSCGICIYLMKQFKKVLKKVMKRLTKKTVTLYNVNMNDTDVKNKKKVFI